MAPPGILEAVDVFKQGQFDLPSGFPIPAPDQFGPEGLEDGAGERHRFERTRDV